MATTTIDLPRPTGPEALPVSFAVFAKATWSGSWVAQTNLHVDRVVWAIAPEIGIAQLFWRYGRGLQPGDLVFSDILPKDIIRFFVKIEFTFNSLTIPGALETDYWYGVVEGRTEEVGGGHAKDKNSGKQLFTAYALESLLFKNSIVTSQAINPVDQTLQSVSRGLTFNHRRLDNKSTTGVAAPGITYPVFSSEKSQATHWTTRDIVFYLVVLHQPGSKTDGPLWNLTNDFDQGTILPTWDRPVVKTHGTSTGQLLNTLLARQRLYSWKVTAAPDPSDATKDIVSFVPFTLATSNIDLGSGHTLKKNNSGFHLNIYDNPRWPVVYRVESSGQYDRVVLQGRRRRSVFTISDADATLVKGWTSTEETDYNNAASLDGGYPAGRDDRRRRNNDSRRTDRLRPVFSRFMLPTQWDLEVSNGIGGTKIPAVADDDNLGLVHQVYRQDIVILPTLPLLHGRDYSGSFDSVTGSTSLPAAWGLSGDQEEMRPVVVIQLPDDATKWATIEAVGMSADLPHIANQTNERWSGSVQVKSREAAFWVRVSGQPQHIIGGADFVPLAEDKVTGTYDWRKIIATVAIEEDRHAEFIFPIRFRATEVVRTLRIDVGKDYRLDYIPFNTVLGIDKETQGLIRAGVGGYVNDSRPELERLARMSFEWYGVDRKSIELSTTTVSNALHTGDILVSFSISDDGAGGTNDLSVNTAISQVSLEFPRVEGTEAQAARISYRTAFVELDPRRI